ncbi:Nickel uptake substrate-specific transmembrane region [compost metagenome]
MTHPNDLVAGEAATFKLVKDGQPAAGVEVAVARGGTRYRDNPEEITVKTDADGAFSVTWPEAGLYWLGASVRTPGVDGQPGSNASWNGVLEVLP